MATSHVTALRRPAQALVALAFAIVVLTAFAPASILAHETRTVATDYEFVVGFIDEPAIQNDTNGIWVEITKAGAPVLAASDTLQAQVLFGEESRDMTLTPAFGEEGVYEAVFIPTQPGDYTFRFFGTLEGVQIDESFISSPEGFDSVAARSELEFPAGEAGSTGDDGALTVATPLVVGTVIVVAGAFGLGLRRRSRAMA